MKSLRSLEGAYGSNLGPIYTCFFKTWTLMEVALKNVKLLPFLASTPLLTLSIQLHLSVPRFPLFYFFYKPSSSLPLQISKPLSVTGFCHFLCLGL